MKLATILALAVCGTVLADPGAMTTASRTSGVAPLAVFFDAVNTTSPSWASGVVQPADGDYASFNYEWDFDDAGCGEWSTSEKGKNGALGHIACHVFETPGTYHVVLTVTDAAQVEWQYTQTITVSEFDGTTYYFSSTGDDDNDGLTEGEPKQTFDAALALIATNRRILFKRGDTWSTNTYHYVSVTGPVILGEYGESGAKPKLSYAASEYAGLMELGASTDVRFMDLDVDGTGLGIGFKDGLANMLYLRCEFDSVSTGLLVDWTNSNHFAAVDCAFSSLGSYGIYLAGGGYVAYQHSAVMGCTFDTGHEHLLRGAFYKGIIEHNTFGSQSGGNARHQIKYWGPKVATPSASYSILSDNQFNEPGSAGLMVSIGPENSDWVEYLNDILIERNIWSVGADTVNTVAIHSRGVNRMTIRNNVANGIGTFVSTENGFVGTGWSDWRLYNNTHYRSGIRTDPNLAGRAFLNVGAVDDWKVYNNIMSFPDEVVDLFAIRSTASLAEFDCNNNVWYVPNISSKFDVGGAYYTSTTWRGSGKDTNGSFADPLMIDPTNGDFSIGVTSPAVDAGYSLPTLVREDWNGQARPIGDSHDIGAYEYLFGDPVESPTLVRAYTALNGQTIRTHYSGAIASVNPVLGFTVLVDGVAREVAGYTVGTTSIVIRLASAVLVGDIVRLSYSDATGTIHSGEHYMAPFSDFVVRNDSTTTAPSYRSGTGAVATCGIFGPK